MTWILKLYPSQVLLKLAILLRFPDATDISWYTQEDTALSCTDYGFKFKADTRKFFFFHDYMGWHNLSERHRKEQCDDPAYCLWHGSL